MCGCTRMWLVVGGFQEQLKFHRAVLEMMGPRKWRAPGRITGCERQGVETLGALAYALSFPPGTNL